MKKTIEQEETIEQILSDIEKLQKCIFDKNIEKTLEEVKNKLNCLV